MKTFNRSNLAHPTLLAKVKAAILEATRQANLPNMAFAHELVRNKEGEPVLHVFAERGRGFEIDTHNGQSVTEDVKAALRLHHACPVIPLAMVEFDSGPMVMTNIHLLAKVEVCCLRAGMAACV